MAEHVVPSEMLFHYHGCKVLLYPSCQSGLSPLPSLINKTVAATHHGVQTLESVSVKIPTISRFEYSGTSNHT